jgi:hypothetical protein
VVVNPALARELEGTADRWVVRDRVSRLIRHLCSTEARARSAARRGADVIEPPLFR